MKEVAVLEVTYPGFDPDLDNALRGAVGRRDDHAGASVGSGESVIRDMSWEFGTMEEAENARDRVVALSLPIEVLAYTYTYVPRTERPGGVGAQDPAAA